MGAGRVYCEREVGRACRFWGKGVVAAACHGQQYLQFRVQDMNSVQREENNHMTYLRPEQSCCDFASAVLEGNSKASGCWGG